MFANPAYAELFVQLTANYLDVVLPNAPYPEDDRLQVAIIIEDEDSHIFTEPHLPIPYLFLTRNENLLAQSPAFLGVDEVFPFCIAENATVFIHILRGILKEWDEKESIGFLKRCAEVGAKITRTISHTLIADEIPPKILALISELIPYDGIQIVLFEEGDAKVRFATGYTPSIRQSLLGQPFPLSLIYEVNTAWEALLGLDTDPDKLARLESFYGIPIGAHLSIPIHKGEQLMGLLLLVSKQPHTFHQGHIDWLLVIMDQLALVLENFQLYETLDRYSSALSSLNRETKFLFTPLSIHEDLSAMCKQIADSVVSVFGTADCGVMLIDFNTRQLLRFARSGTYQVNAVAPLFLDGEGLAVMAARTGSVIYAPDVSKNEHYIPNESRTKSELVVPLKTQMGVIGILDLQSPYLNGFPQRDMDGLFAFAEHVAMAIQNLQLYEQVLTHSNELENRVIERTVQLNAEKDRIGAILDRTTDAIALIARNGIIETVNPALVNLIGLTTDQLLGHPFTLMVDPAYHDDVASMFREVISQMGTPQSTEVQIVNNGITVELSVVAYKTAQDGYNIVCSMHDVTKHKTIEDNLRGSLNKERELSELKTRFVLTASHEFRTPLTIILSSSEMLELSIERMNEKQKLRHFNNIRQQVLHMEQMLSDVLLIGKAEANTIQFEPISVDLLELCQQNLDNLQSTTTSHHINFQSFGKGFIAPVDTKLFAQIINNLVSNAIKYSPKADCVDVTLTHEGDSVCLVVRDYGIGIPEKDHPHLFKPFHRARNVGTIQGNGLGLAIVRHAVERHKGTLEIQSQENVGTQVSIHLPLEPTKSTSETHITSPLMA
ncbi:MAG: ATP-binding protein [Phototrophicaceae bacterium]